MGRKIYIFPGMASLKYRKHRIAWLHIPEVLQAIDDAEKTYLEEFGIPLNAIELLHVEDAVFNDPENLAKATLLSAILPIGASRYLENNGRPMDLIVGFSGGSLPAPYIAGGFSFRSMVRTIHNSMTLHNTYRFHLDCELHTCFSLWGFSDKKCEWLRSFNIGVSKLNYFAIFISGDKNNIKAALSHPKTKNWTTNQVLSTSFHSPIADYWVQEAIPKINFYPTEEDTNLTKSLYSFHHHKEITTPEDYYKFLEMMLRKEISWGENMKELRQKYDIDEIIAISPETSIDKMIKYNPWMIGVKVTSIRDLLPKKDKK